MCICSQRSVALVLRPMAGVAYTTGNSKHKEIHLSTDYIDTVDKKRLKDEIEGVVRHEMVRPPPFTARLWLTR